MKIADSVERQERRATSAPVAVRVLLLACGGAALGVVGLAARAAQPAEPPRRVPAFPGAEGFGVGSVGGRGGRVIEVTSLADTGPGSFRAAAEAAGPRIVVFRVGGTIALKTWVRIQEPYITVAGQTAPGGGICLRNDPSNRRPTLAIATRDVIVRHLRVRPGASREKSNSVDGISVIKGHNVILDHCSISWATDGVLDVTGLTEGHDITVQWCIVAEGLHKSTHEKGPHSTGLAVAAERVSLHHNLIAHNQGRNPRLAYGRPIDVVNNVIYNWGGYAAAVSYTHDPQINLVANYFKPGPSSIDRHHVRFIATKEGTSPSVFVRGNLGPRRPRDDVDEAAIVEESGRRFVTGRRFDAPPLTTTSAAAAFTVVLDQAGATRPMRDAVDRRIVADAEKGAGRIIDDPSQVGGWPDLAPGSPPPDADHDGMPDAWEIQHALNPHDPADGPQDSDGDGYTNVEEYLNGTDPRARDDAQAPATPATRSR